MKLKKTETTTERTTAETQLTTAGHQQPHEIVLPTITREYVHSIRGTFRGKGLLKALEEDRKHQRAAEEI